MKNIDGIQKTEEMLKTLHKTYLLLEEEEQDTAPNICNKVGLALKYWKKLIANNIIINTTRTRQPTKPTYKWNTNLGTPTISLAIRIIDNSELWGNVLLSDKNTIVKKGINIPFDKFWDLYDKKVGSKSYAEKKWKKLKDSERKKIMETLPDWKKQITHKQFQPFPSTYLNNERWNDEITEPIKQDDTLPSLETVKAYCEERKSSINPNKFFNYYNERGWKSKNEIPIKNWKNKIYKWEQNQVLEQNRDKSKPDWKEQLTQICNEYKCENLSDKDLIQELKKRGYSGVLNKETKF